MPTESNYETVLDKEQLDAQELVIQPDMGLMDYVEHLTQVQDDWRGFANSKRPQTFIQAVTSEMESIIDTQEPEEIEAAQQLLITYGSDVVALKKYHAWNPWILKVRALAGLSMHLPGTNDSTEPLIKTEKTYQVEAFWKKIYEASVAEPHLRVANFNYVLGPNIAGKDPSILSAINERLVEEPVTEVFQGFTKNPHRLIRTSFDVFKQLLDEATESGWDNARAVNGMLEKIPLKDMPLHSVIIELGNQITTLLNRSGATPEGVNFDRLDIYQPEHMGEAINRCMYLMFELGKSGDNDPINYMLTAQILTKFCEEAARQIRN
jgi:hypothetical protein